MLFAAGGFNLAGGKPTDQSDTSGDAVSSRAVDGNIDPQFFTGNTCSSTTRHANAWWRVDLGQLEFVAHVFIQFMDGCCDPNATHFLIEAGEFSSKHFVFTRVLIRRHNPGTSNRIL